MGPYLMSTSSYGMPPQHALWELSVKILSSGIDRTDRYCHKFHSLTNVVFAIATDDVSFDDEDNNVDDGDRDRFPFFSFKSSFPTRISHHKLFSPFSILLSSIPSTSSPIQSIQNCR